MKWARMTLAIVCSAFLLTSVGAQEQLLDRKLEAQKYPELQNTEKIHENNLQISIKVLARFGHLVNLAKKDRQTMAQELADPQNFKNTFRFITYTPRNTYVRYTEDVVDPTDKKTGKVVKGNFILAGFGDPKEIQALMDHKISQAQSIGVKTNKVAFNQKRPGLELTQFEFIYDYETKTSAQVPPKRIPTGSRRKSLSLYYKPGGASKNELDLIVVKIVHDRLLEGIRHTQLILDPSPNDDNFDDIIILDRYNQKPTVVSILGMMSNNPNYPHRNEFKQKFYGRLLAHFYQLFKMVDNYAKRDGNSYNEKALHKLRRSMEY